jgi:hypothetical protein
MTVTAAIQTIQSWAEAIEQIPAVVRGQARRHAASKFRLLECETRSTERALSIVETAFAGLSSPSEHEDAGAVPVLAGLAEVYEAVLMARNGEKSWPWVPPGPPSEAAEEQMRSWPIVGRMRLRVSSLAGQMLERHGNIAEPGKRLAGIFRKVWQALPAKVRQTLETHWSPSWRPAGCPTVTLTTRFSDEDTLASVSRDGCSFKFRVDCDMRPEADVAHTCAHELAHCYRGFMGWDKADADADEDETDALATAWGFPCPLDVGHDKQQQAAPPPPPPEIVLHPVINLSPTFQITTPPPVLNLPPPAAFEVRRDEQGRIVGVAPTCEEA